jgi:Na+-driven multidrug efflux pump
MFVPFIQGVLRSLDHKYLLIVYNSISALVVLPYITYTITISNDFALFGVFSCIFVEMLIRLVIYYFAIINADWKNKNNFLREIDASAYAKLK